jgi:hypothetical protein
MGARTGIHTDYGKLSICMAQMCNLVLTVNAAATLANKLLLATILRVVPGHPGTRGILPL